MRTQRKRRAMQRRRKSLTLTAASRRCMPCRSRLSSTTQWPRRSLRSTWRDTPSRRKHSSSPDSIASSSETGPARDSARAERSSRSLWRGSGGGGSCRSTTRRDSASGATPATALRKSLSSGGEPIEKFLRVESGHAAAPRAGHGLAINSILHIPGGEHSLDAGRSGKTLAPAAGDEVAVFHLELAGEELGIRRMPDGDEQPFRGDLAPGAALQISCLHAGHAALVAEHFLDDVVEQQRDRALGDGLHQLVHHDFLGAELFAAVDQHHMAADVRQVERLLDRGIAAAHYHDVLALVEKAVAGRACRNAATHVLPLRGEPQLPGGGAGGI